METEMTAQTSRVAVGGEYLSALLEGKVVMSGASIKKEEDKPEPKKSSYRDRLRRREEDKPDTEGLSYRDKLRMKERERERRGRRCIGCGSETCTIGPFESI